MCCGNIAPDAKSECFREYYARKRLRFYLGLKGGMRVKLGHVQIVNAYILSRWRTFIFRFFILFRAGSSTMLPRRFCDETLSVRLDDIFLLSMLGIEFFIALCLSHSDPLASRMSSIIKGNHYPYSTLLCSHFTLEL